MLGGYLRRPQHAVLVGVDVDGGDSEVSDHDDKKELASAEQAMGAKSPCSPVEIAARVSSPGQRQGFILPFSSQLHIPHRYPIKQAHKRTRAVLSDMDA